MVSRALVGHGKQGIGMDKPKMFFITCMDCKRKYHAVIPVDLPVFCRFCKSEYLMWKPT